MPFFNGGSFTHSMVSDTEGGSAGDLFSNLPAILQGTAQSVVAITQAIRGKPVAPIGVQVGVAPETQRAGLTAGAILLVVVVLFLMMRR